jgi:D-inositol-3-phosphate glycosyltransferase
MLLPLMLGDVYPCDSIVCTSDAARKALQQLLSRVSTDFHAQFGVRREYRGRLDLIPLGVDTDALRPIEPSSARQRFGIPPDATVILCAGRFSLTSKMDLYPLLAVFRELVEANPKRDLLFLLAGANARNDRVLVEDHIRELALGDRVRQIIDFPAADKTHLYTAADVFVSPADNIQESFGLTPIEAMACGVPQVVSDWDGYRHTVRNGETGFLVPTYWTRCDSDLEITAKLFGWEYDHLCLSQSVAVDVRCLFQRLQTLIADETLRRNMGVRSRQYAVSNFDLRLIVCQYEGLWRELKTISDRISYLPSPVRYDSPKYFRTFGHYASNLLD